MSDQYANQEQDCKGSADQHTACAGAVASTGMNEIDGKTDRSGHRSAAQSEFTTGGQTVQEGNRFPAAGQGCGKGQGDQSAG